MLTENYAVKANTKWNKWFIVRVHWCLFIFLFFLIISLIFHYLSTYSTSAKPTLWHMPVSFFHNRSFFFSDPTDQLLTLHTASIENRSHDAACQSQWDLTGAVCTVRKWRKKKRKKNPHWAPAVSTLSAKRANVTSVWHCTVVSTQS